MHHGQSRLRGKKNREGLKKVITFLADENRRKFRNNEDNGGNASLPLGDGRP